MITDTELLTYMWEELHSHYKFSKDAPHAYLISRCSMDGRLGVIALTHPHLYKKLNADYTDLVCANGIEGFATVDSFIKKYSAEVAPEYRLLITDDVIKYGDELLDQHTFEWDAEFYKDADANGRFFIGNAYHPLAFVPMRRKM